jgi:hypothetical protein
MTLINYLEMIKKSNLKSNRKNPCKECPFRRDNILKGENPGGSSPEVYIGQIQGPFWLPCHTDKNYKDKQSDPRIVEQCAGAAIFRKNCKEQLSYSLPKELLFLESNSDLVFSNFEEFYSYYKKISIEQAKKYLTKSKLEELLIKEIYEFKHKIY